MPSSKECRDNPNKNSKAATKEEFQTLKQLLYFKIRKNMYLTNLDNQVIQSEIPNKCFQGFWSPTFIILLLLYYTILLVYCSITKVDFLSHFFINLSIFFHIFINLSIFFFQTCKRSWVIAKVNYFFTSILHLKIIFHVI